MTVCGVTVAVLDFVLAEMQSRDERTLLAISRALAEALLLRVSEGPAA
eukprot:CAMPEP_0172173706 /NCGR_PEP_ID=MMETSP1050-20130122/13222_1 /TAXON_ID=233186 /ORGANISM="Cryptomonas curvata, Strain CCAP979/52" /LENGTH=47 /DNA_ID= /DNA_START= /DNA_END= /DNA_ORIENTATION=